MAGLKGGRERRAQASEGSTRAINPVESRLDAYLHQIHRDWGWHGDDTASSMHPELREALQAIEAAVGSEASLGTMLVVGGGSARLPYEVHRRWAELSVVLDVDVLAVTIARQILAGNTVELSEFPTGPRDADSAAVRRSLRADPSTLEAAETFHLLFADGLEPPVRDASFDTVFTPWFIDQVPTDLAQFVKVVRRVLVPGGRWINHGPLIYEPRHTMLIHRYTADEVRAILEEAGFEVTWFECEAQPFLQSPASTRGRTETILTFVASKRADADASADHDEGPRASWQDDPTQPIVPWPGLARYQPPHPMFAAIIALIDGQRSPQDIAEVLVRRNGLPEDAALGGVLAALAEMLRATQDAE
jgi:carnosine N-methyltransferase